MTSFREETNRPRSRHSCCFFMLLSCLLFRRNHLHACGVPIMILRFLIRNLGRAVLDGTRPIAYVSWRAWVSKRFTFSVTRPGLGATTMRYLKTGGRLGTLCLVQRNQYESARSCSCVHHLIKWIIFHNCRYRYPFLHRAPSWWNDAVTLQY